MTMPLLPFNLKLATSEAPAQALGSVPAVGPRDGSAVSESFAAALELAVAAQPNAAPAPATTGRPVTPENAPNDATPFGGQTRKRRDDGRGRAGSGAIGSAPAPTIALNLLAPALLSTTGVAPNSSASKTSESGGRAPNEAPPMPAAAHTVLTEEALAGLIVPNGDTSGADRPVFVPLDHPGEIHTLPVGEPIFGLPNMDVPSDPGRVQRDPEALATEFRGRLTRVVDRMRDEFGYNVEIVEALRTPARQAALFAQGRSQPGQVVTWTLDSKHLSGNAVDVRIDGRYDNPLAFQRLAAVAREEGLQTLGTRDPGHVELAPASSEGRSAVASARRLPNALVTAQLPNAQVAAQQPAVQQTLAQQPSLQQAAPANVASSNGVARVAAVARVAEVAPVARVAAVAAMASVGGPISNAPVRAPTRARVIPAAGESRVAEGEAPQQAPVARDARASGIRNEVSALALAALSGGDPSLTNVAEPAAGEVAAARSVDMSERVAAILDVHNRAQDRPVSSLLLRLEHPELGTDRLRVDMRQNSVGATLDVANARAADQLNAHIGDLRRALEAQGLETDHLTIRHATRAPDAPLPAAERDVLRGAPLPPDSVLNALSARDNVTTLRSSSRSSDQQQQQTPDQRQQRGRKDPQGGR